MRDEQVREAFLLPELEQQLDDLRADRHVEHGHRLVGDEEFRIEDEGPGDRNALPLSAAEFVREPEQEVSRWPEARIVEGLLDARLRLGAVAADPIHDERLRDDVVHGVLRVQGFVRILENDLQFPSEAPDLHALESLFVQTHADDDPSRHDGGDEREQRPAEHRDRPDAPVRRPVDRGGIQVAREHEADERPDVEDE